MKSTCHSITISYIGEYNKKNEKLEKVKKNNIRK